MRFLLENTLNPWAAADVPGSRKSQIGNVFETLTDDDTGKGMPPAAPRGGSFYISRWVGKLALPLKYH